MSASDLVYIVSELIVLFGTLLTLLYMYTRLRRNRWYTIHALPLMLYSAHVIVYYIFVIMRRSYGIEPIFPIMYWSIALRVHGMVMVATMARTVVLCCHQN